ncbi:MAG: glycerophosphodiester phosphodiesterase [Candidatus Saccharimonas sp.]|nr:glycerophosphodiester phosphodiesterase [Planctomycetaceae bacterium]
MSAAAEQTSARSMEIVAHRGASHDAPENTLASFKLGWAQQADAVELDIMLSKDGRIIVIHDKDTKRLAGVDRPVVEQTLAELRSLDAGRWKDAKWAGEKLPLLSEVLATIPDGKRLFIEVKCGAEVIPELVRELKEAGKTPEQTAIIGFSADAMAAVKQALPILEVYWIVNIKPDPKSDKKPLTVDELIATAKRIKADGLDLSACDALDKTFGDKVRAAGLKLAVWTVNDPAVARAMQAAGVQSLTTDRPGWMREQLQKK